MPEPTRQGVRPSSEVRAGAFTASLDWAWDVVTSSDSCRPQASTTVSEAAISRSRAISERGLASWVESPTGGEVTVSHFVWLFEWLDAAVLAARATGVPEEWVVPWFRRIEARLESLAATAEQDRASLDELIQAGPLIRTVCVRGAEYVHACQDRFAAAWATWEGLISAHPTYVVLVTRRRSLAARPWHLERLIETATDLGAQTGTSQEAVLDCLLGNVPLPFGPSDDRELRFGRHGYAHAPPGAAIAAVEALALGEGDVFYDLGSGLGSPTLLATLASRARCRGIEVHDFYVHRATATAKAFGLREDLFVVADVTDYDWSDGNKFFLFNPFVPEVLEWVSDRLRRLGRCKTVDVACLYAHLGEGFAVTARRGAVTVYRTTGC